MKKFICRLVSAVCILALVFTGLTACGQREITEDTTDKIIENVDESWLDDVSTKKKNPESVSEPDYTGKDTVSVGVNGVTVPDPFGFKNGEDMTAAELIMIRLLETDRDGYVIKNGITGEATGYNGTEYTYNGIADVKIVGSSLEFTLNDEIYFSDGVNLTADDVIFTMYVLSDPTYDGESDFAKLPIEGLEQYRGEMRQKWKAILTDLCDGTKSGGYTDEEKASLLSAFHKTGIAFTEDIVNGCVANFAESYSNVVLGISADELMENEGYKVAFAQYIWDESTGYGEDGLWYDTAGNSYDLEETFPTVEDYWKLIVEKYGYDISDNGINYEKIGERSFEDILISVIREEYPELMVASVDSDAADSINGIKKTGTYSFTVSFTELSPEHLRAFCFYIAPLHYYGNRDEYKYSEHKFGFAKGDLSTIKSKAEVPLGAGTYTLSRVGENGELYLKRNKLYYKGCPKIENIVITLDAENSDIQFKKYTARDIYTDNYAEAESSTYIFVGINADAVSVNGEPLSEQSVSLRSAFSCVLNTFCDIAVEQWDKHGLGEELSCEYDEDITEPARNKAVELLKAAGYTWDDSKEKFTQAPTGADMTYEVKLYDRDAAYIVLSCAKELLSEIGINLELAVQSSRKSLENVVSIGGAQMWVMQIEDFNVEDIYELFHSMGESNVFSAATDAMDDEIEWADSLFLKNVSNAMYNEIIEEAEALGIIIPIYKQINAVVYSDDIVPESLTPDMTDFWSWTREAYLLEAK